MNLPQGIWISPGSTPGKKDPRVAGGFATYPGVFANLFKT
jgi:hypothetical protein